MNYEDLLSVPYKPFGRDQTGLDCYGLVLEMARRNGKELKDIVYPSNLIDAENLSDYLENANIKIITEQERKAGDVIQCEYNGNLHIAFLLDKTKVIHATFEGVRITPLIAFKNIKYGRII